MMTTAQNPVSVIDHDAYPQSVVVTTQFTVNEGDMLFWDAVNFSARPVIEPKDAETGKTAHNSEGLMGVALGSNKPEVYGGDEAIPQVPILARATVFFNSTAGQKYKPFEAVTIGADAQTITNAGVTANNRVGFIIIDPPAVARAEQATPVPEEVEGAAGVRVRVLLEVKHAPGKII